MNRTVKVFLACAIGALVGSLIALQINGVFWWMGLLAGGLTGYLSYEFSTVIRMIPRAWRMATSWRMNWARLYSPLLSIARHILGIVMMAVTFASYSVFGAIFNIYSWNDVSETFVAFASIFFFFMLVCFKPLITDVTMSSKEVVKYGVISLLCANPVVVSVWFLPRFLFWVLPRGIFWVAVRTPKAIRIIAVVLARFVYYLFRLIHSEERLLCGVDAGIGTIIGYISGNAFVGALAGGIFGVLNYEILSKRVFHLVPTRNAKSL